MRTDLTDLLTKAAAANIETEMKKIINDGFAPGRERAIAITKIEEASMWLARSEYVGEVR